MTGGLEDRYPDLYPDRSFEERQREVEKWQDWQDRMDNNDAAEKQVVAERSASEEENRSG
jgi:hypothetical protein